MNELVSECQQVALCCSSLVLCSQCLSRMNPLDMMRISELPHKSNRVSDWKVTAANMTHSTFHSIISAHLLSSLLHSCSHSPLPPLTHLLYSFLLTLSAILYFFHFFFCLFDFFLSSLSSIILSLLPSFLLSLFLFLPLSLSIFFVSLPSFLPPLSIHCCSSSSSLSSFLLYGGWWIRDSGNSCYHRHCSRQQRGRV